MNNDNFNLISEIFKSLKTEKFSSLKELKNKIDPLANDLGFNFEKTGSTRCKSNFHYRVRIYKNDNNQVFYLVYSWITHLGIGAEKYIKLTDFFLEPIHSINKK